MSIIYNKEPNTYKASRFIGLFILFALLIIIPVIVFSDSRLGLSAQSIPWLFMELSLAFAIADELLQLREALVRRTIRIANEPGGWRMKVINRKTGELVDDPRIAKYKAGEYNGDPGRAYRMLHKPLMVAAVACYWLIVVTKGIVGSWDQFLLFAVTAVLLTGNVAKRG